MNWSQLRAKIENHIKSSKGEFRSYDFDEAFSLLLRERFITRAAHSAFKDSIILKGGLLLTMLYTKSTRYTGDADIGLRNVHTLEEYQTAIDSILAVDLEDGFSFSRNEGAILSNTLREYDGAQFNITCSFDNRQRIQFILDIGVGDDVEPAKAKLPTLADFESSSIEMQVYPPETIAAEKFHAVVALGARNTRFKDFYDLYVLRDHVDQEKFAIAVIKTFKRRKTKFPDELPLEPKIIARMQPGWERFLISKQYRIIKSAPQNFQEVATAIREFYMAVKS